MHVVIHWAVLILAWSSPACSQHAAEGTSFVTAVPQNQLGSGVSLILDLMTRGSENVTVFVRSLSTSSKALSDTLQVYPGKATSVNYKAQLEHPSGTVITNDGIEITSTAPIFVDVFHDGWSNSDFHPLIPHEYLGKEYFAVGYESLSTDYTANFILIVAESADTEVSVDLGKLQNGETIKLNNVTYDHWDLLTVDLDALQTLQIQAVSDLTGTRIASTEAVAVYSGQNRTSIPGHPQFYCLSHASDQLPPVDNLGRKFVLVSFAVHIYGSLFRFVAAKPVTTVVVESAPRTVIRLKTPGDFYEYDLASGSVLFAESDKPVMVVTFTKSSKMGDASMGVVAPLEQAENFYAFSFTSTRFTYDLFFSLAVESSKQDGIRVDNGTTSEFAVTWQAVPESEMVVGTFNVSSDGLSMMTFRHDDGDSFTVHVSAGRNCEAMTMPLTYGKPLVSVSGNENAACVATNQVTGDSFDNDCDGQVDEENCDSSGQLTDSDGDGFIGEDCAALEPATTRSARFRANQNIRRRAETIQTKSVWGLGACVNSCLQQEDCFGVNFLSSGVPAGPIPASDVPNCEVLVGRGAGRIDDALWSFYDIL